MKQLIRLKNIDLYKITQTQSSDGDFIKTSSLVNSYKAAIEELRDEISATVYGSDINKMVRFSSVKHELEDYLYSKLNNTSDNISKYEIRYGQNKYNISNLTHKYIDGKRYE